MIALVPLVLIAWLALAAWAAQRRPTYQVVLAVFVFGLMFLPEVRAVGPAPDQPPPLAVLGFKLTKTNVMSYAALLAALLGDGRWRSFRFRWFDAPMVVWCVVPLFASVSSALFYDEPPPLAGLADGARPLLRSAFMYLEHLRIYDGFAQSLDQAWAWAVPYFLGRVYFADAYHFQFIPLAIFVGGLIYVPLCLIEVRISPQLHHLLYGFHPHDFEQTIRYSGYRPTVFMEHGLAVGLWMVSAALLGFWLWQTGSLSRENSWKYRPAQAGWLVFALVVTAVLCKSTGALVLGAVGLVVIATRRWAPIPVALILLLCAAPLYIGTRTTGVWDGQDLVDLVSTDLDADRAASVEFRFKNENLLLEKAFERPIFGWGGWGRALLYDEMGDQSTVADGLWIIALGDRGLVGLTALCLTMLLPSIRFAWRYPPALWSDPRLAPAAGMAVVLALWMVDSLMNAMLNPVFILALGGLAGLVGTAAPPPVLPYRKKAWGAVPARIAFGKAGTGMPSR